MITEKSKAILPVEYPWITTYPLFANPLSILLQYQNTYHYLYSSFIQIICCKKNGAISFFDFNYKYCPFINVQKINRSIIRDFSDYLTALKYFLSKGYYLYFLINPKYIEAYRMSEDSFHDIFVYGFNDEERTFNIADNFTGKYSFRVCSYVELERAILEIDPKFEGYLGFYGGIELLSFNSNEKYTGPFINKNILRVRDSLLHYIRGTGDWNSSSPEMRVEAYGANKFVYGINSYRFLVDNLQTNGIEKLHFPSCYLIYDHKMQLSRVIEYLIQMNALPNLQKYRDTAKVLCSISQKNIYYLLKEGIRKNVKIEKRIVENYMQMEKYEKQLIKDILCDIRIY